MKITAETRSDQWNADDLISGPRTFTIAGARKGAAEQPYDIVFEGEEKVWRPPVTVRKILTTAWGDESDEWVGRKVTLFRDPSIRFGPNQVGGVRISHMSGIGAPVKVVLNATRGKRSLHTVQPLPDAPTAPTPAEVAKSTDQVQLQAWWAQFPALHDAIRARVAELKAKS